MLQLLGIDHLQEPIDRVKGMPLYQFFFCIKGQGEFILHHRKYLISPGDGALLYPDEPHSYHGLTADWTLDFIGFSGSLCTDFLKNLYIPESSVFHFSDAELFPLRLHQIYALYSNKDSASSDLGLSLSKELYGFLLELSVSAKKSTSSSPIIENALVQRILIYLEENYASDFSLTALSDYTNRSKEYLCSIFKKEMKQTIMKYLLTIRIGHARIFLLLYPEKKCFEIAKMCGFESSNYFIRVFKSVLGCTPEQYRLSDTSGSKSASTR